MYEITQPPGALYTHDQLMKGYKRNDPATITATFTFNQYLAFKPLQRIGPLPGQSLAAISAHDARVTELLLNFLDEKISGEPRKVVGFMGGHSVARSTQEYADLANLARFLSGQGYLVVTGGGPGMMEAAHLGAHFSRAPQKDWEDILAELKEVCNGKDKVECEKSGLNSIPKTEIKGDADTGYKVAPEQQASLHAWYRFAADLRDRYPVAPRESLAISTWEYGKEPVMPFATHYACYFQNTIRESHLVRESRAGIVFARGGGGTLREIWQDVEENFYVTKREDLTPMIFFDREAIWGDLSSNGTKPLDVYSTIMRVLNYRLASHSFSWEDKVVATTSHGKILGLLDKHLPVAQDHLKAGIARMIKI